MKLGIGTYATMWAVGFGERFPQKHKSPLTAIELLQRAHDLGVSLVQVGPNLPLDRLSEQELARFDRQAREWGIEIELATRGLEADHLANQVALAQRLGCTLVRTIPEIGGESTSARDVPAYLRQVLPLFEPKGIRLALENGNIPAADLRAALEAVSSPQIGIVLDTANSLIIPEGWRHVAQALAPFTMCLHVKDFVIQRVWSMMGFVLEGRPAGQGQLDIPWLLEILNAANARFNVVLELWPPYQGSMQATVDLEQRWLEESVRYLRTLVPD